MSSATSFNTSTSTSSSKFIISAIHNIERSNEFTVSSPRSEVIGISPTSSSWSSNPAEVFDAQPSAGSSATSFGHTSCADGASPPSMLCSLPSIQKRVKRPSNIASSSRSAASRFSQAVLIHRRNAKQANHRPTILLNSELIPVAPPACSLPSPETLEVPRPFHGSSSASNPSPVNQSSSLFNWPRVRSKRLEACSTAPPAFSLPSPNFDAPLSSLASSLNRSTSRRFSAYTCAPPPFSLPNPLTLDGTEEVLSIEEDDYASRRFHGDDDAETEYPSSECSDEESRCSTPCSSFGEEDECNEEYSQDLFAHPSVLATAGEERWHINGGDAIFETNLPVASRAIGKWCLQVQLAEDAHTKRRVLGGTHLLDPSTLPIESRAVGCPSDFNPPQRDSNGLTPLDGEVYFPPSSLPLEHRAIGRVPPQTQREDTLLPLTPPGCPLSSASAGMGILDGHARQIRQDRRLRGEDAQVDRGRETDRPRSERDLEEHEDVDVPMIRGDLGL